MEHVEAYKDHVIDQALTILKAHDDIKCMFTTPKLLEALCRDGISLKKAGITGIFCGGTEMTPQLNRFALEELLDGALHRADLRQHADGPGRRTSRAEPEDNYAIIYYAPQPRAVIEVVDLRRSDAAGRTTARPGRVRLTTLTKEFFMPRFLERDEGERERPCEKYPWDGVRNVRPVLPVPEDRRRRGLLNRESGARNA